MPLSGLHVLRYRLTPRLRVAQMLDKPKICELDITVAREQYIFWLDITVQQSPFMQVREGGCNTMRDAAQDVF